VLGVRSFVPWSLPYRRGRSGLLAAAYGAGGSQVPIEPGSPGRVGGTQPPCSGYGLRSGNVHGKPRTAGTRVTPSCASERGDFGSRVGEAQVHIVSSRRFRGVPVRTPRGSGIYFAAA